MGTAWLHVAIPVLALAVDVAGQVLVFRLGGCRGLLRSIFAGFFLGLVCVVATEAFTWRAGVGVSDPLGILAASVLIYGALGYGYFHFVNLGQTARRVRILRELLEADHDLSEADILERYNAREIVRLRVGRLLGSGQVVSAERRYTIGRPTMLIFSRLIVALKLLVLGRRSESE